MAVYGQFCCEITDEAVLQDLTLTLSPSLTLSHANALRGDAMNTRRCTHGLKSWDINRGLACPLTQLVLVRISSNAKIISTAVRPVPQCRLWATWLRWRVTFFGLMIWQ